MWKQGVIRVFGLDKAHGAPHLKEHSGANAKMVVAMMMSGRSLHHEPVLAPERSHTRPG